ncbi:MAG: FAD-dependent oxidoreductase [Phycisphaeraceae bacterium JB051]
MSNLHYFKREWITPSDETINVDIAIYGGTASGIIAAVTAAQRGKSVVVLQPGKHVGGMTTGGLGWTDFGRKHVIGGKSREFYNMVGKLYGLPEEWQFEPSKARKVIDTLIADNNIDVRYCQYVDAVETTGGKITAAKMLGGQSINAKMWIDASYEGDLMAKAGVSFTTGREANSQYDEKLNGIQVRDKHQFSHPVDPYKVAGDPDSGLLPMLEEGDFTAKQGEGDKRLQAYNFRVCMTDDPQLKIDWAKPDGFEPELYELVSRWFNAEKDGYNEQIKNSPDTPCKFDVFPNKTPGGHRKTDTNNHGAVSSDFIGGNWEWPDASYERREELFQRHVAWQQGYYWFVANDESIPQRYRDAYSTWGLPKDEFTDTGNWPHQLYVRECRRMVADYVITEHDCLGNHVQDSVGMGSYTMDSHNCTRFAKVIDGKAWVLNDGDVQIPPTDPYPVSYRAVVPKVGEIGNLFVPVCFSASHIAYGSARMEPVFMALGESVAIAASLCLDESCPVQELPYDHLQPELVKAKQVLFDPTKQ